MTGYESSEMHRGANESLCLLIQITLFGNPDYVSVIEHLTQELVGFFYDPVQVDQYGPTLDGKCEYKKRKQ